MSITHPKVASDINPVTCGDFNAEHVVKNLYGYELVEEKNVSAGTTSVTFENLDGDLVKEYLLEYELSAIASTSNFIGKLIFNDIDTDTYDCQEMYQVEGNSGTGRWNRLWPILSTYNENLLYSYGTFKVLAESGKYRLCDGRIVRKSTNHLCQSTLQGYWSNTVDNITKMSLIFAFGVQGTIRLWKRIPVEV